MLVLRPELVRRHLIADDHAERAPSWDVVPAPGEFIPRSGVLMRPTDANEEAGKRFLEASIGRLVEAIRTEFGERLSTGRSSVFRAKRQRISGEVQSI